jgi:hypothetical protein
MLRDCVRGLDFSGPLFLLGSRKGNDCQCQCLVLDVCQIQVERAAQLSAEQQADIMAEAKKELG